MARQKREIHLCTKTINNIEFTSHEYKSGKYLITAKGYEGNRWVGYETWEKRNNGDVTDGRSSFSPKNKRWFKTSFTQIINVPKITTLFPMPLLLNAPKTIKDIELDFVSEKLTSFTRKEWGEIYDEEGYEEFISYVYTEILCIEIDKRENTFKEVYKFLIKLHHSDLVKENDDKAMIINTIFK